jgi:hypothetical protein
MHSPLFSPLSLFPFPLPSPLYSLICTLISTDSFFSTQKYPLPYIPSGLFPLVYREGCIRSKSKGEPSISKPKSPPLPSLFTLFLSLSPYLPLSLISLRMQKKQKQRGTKHFKTKRLTRLWHTTQVQSSLIPTTISFILIELLLLCWYVEERGEVGSGRRGRGRGARELRIFSSSSSSLGSLLPLYFLLNKVV